MESAHLRDDPWGRLVWHVPLAALVTFAGLAAFTALLEPPADVGPPARPVEVEVAELPPPVAAPAVPRPAPVERPRPRPIAEPKPPVARVEPPPPREPAPPREAEPPRPAAPPSEAPRPPEPVAPRQDVLPREPAAAAPSAGPPVESREAVQSAPAPAPRTPARADGDAGGAAARAPAERGAPPAPGTRGSGLGGGSAGARAIYQPLPELPETLRRRSIDIVAVARFRVGADGRAEVELTEPTPDADLNRAVLEALRRWRFFPALDNGKPVASTLEIRIPITVK